MYQRLGNLHASQRLGSFEAVSTINNPAKYGFNGYENEWAGWTKEGLGSCTACGTFGDVRTGGIGLVLGAAVLGGLAHWTTSGEATKMGALAGAVLGGSLGYFAFGSETAAPAPATPEEAAAQAAGKVITAAGDVASNLVSKVGL